MNLRSVRLDAALDERLARAASHLGATESEVIRLALERYCSEVEQDERAGELVALVQEWEAEDEASGVSSLPVIDTASHSGELYSEAAWAKWLKKQGEPHAAEDVRRVAEERAPFDFGPRPAAD